MILKNRAANIVVYLLIILAPLIQLGLSYYLSVSVILFIIFSFLSVGNIDVNPKNLAILFVGSLPFLFKAILLTFSASNTRTVLYPLRELICFLGFVLITQFLSENRFNSKYLYRAILTLSSLILLLQIYQGFEIGNGRYFGFPQEWYVFNKATLSGVDLALLYGTRLRPTAFYGEPSYTSWIVLSTLVVILSSVKISTRGKIIISIITLTAVAVSQSVAGILAVIISIGVWLVMSKSSSISFSKLFLSFSAACLLLGITLYFSNDLQARLDSIINMTDESSNVRFKEPLYYVEQMIAENQIFGLGNYDDIQIDNGLIGTFVQYGLLTLIILPLILIICKKPLLMVYVLLSLNFNGAVFRFDKSIVLGVTVGLGIALSKPTALRKNPKGVSYPGFSREQSFV